MGDQSHPESGDQIQSTSRDWSEAGGGDQPHSQGERKGQEEPPPWLRQGMVNVHLPPIPSLTGAWETAIESWKLTRLSIPTPSPW